MIVCLPLLYAGVGKLTLQMLTAKTDQISQFDFNRLQMLSFKTHQFPAEIC